MNLPDGLSSEILAWGEELIPDEGLFSDPNDPSFGRENELHVTVLYGLHTEKVEDVEKLLVGKGNFVIRLGQVSIFQNNDKFDVVKIEAISPALCRLNQVLSRNLDNTNNFPNYQPHVTIAYVHKGVADHLVGDKSFAGRDFVARSVIFSSRNGKRTPVPLE